MRCRKQWFYVGRIFMTARTGYQSYSLTTICFVRIAEKKIPLSVTKNNSYIQTHSIYVSGIMSAWNVA